MFEETKRIFLWKSADRLALDARKILRVQLRREDYVHIIGRRQFTPPVGFQEGAVVDVVQKEERAGAAFQPRPYETERHVQALALFFRDINAKVWRQIDQENAQVHRSGSVQEKSAA